MGDIFALEKSTGLIPALIGLPRLSDVLPLGIGATGFTLGEAFLIRRGSLRWRVVCTFLMLALSGEKGGCGLPWDQSGLYGEWNVSLETLCILRYGGVLNFGSDGIQVGNEGRLGLLLGSNLSGKVGPCMKFQLGSGNLGPPYPRSFPNCCTGPWNLGSPVRGGKW